MNQKFKFTYILTIAFTIIYFGSCKNNNSVEIQTIDSLQTALNEALKTIESIDENKNEEISTAVDTNIKYLSENLKDTIEFKTGIMFQQYKVVHKEIKRYNQIKGQLKENIKYTINQLEKLKIDFSDGKIDKTKAAGFIKIEKEEAIKLIDLVKERSSTLSFEYKQFDSLHPLVLDFNKKIKI